MAYNQNRDLRSASQDPKRAKERNAKWARGSRPSAGCKYNVWEPEVILTGSESQRAKVRPERQYENHRLPSHNIVKAKLLHDIPQSRSRAKVNAMEELNDPALSRSLLDMLPSPNSRLLSRQKSSISDNFLYSFDRADSPGKPLSLDIFVKTNTKETEKFVEKEYEILDNNGDALKGRKARRNLRRPAQATISEPEIVEDDGFELV